MSSYTTAGFSTCAASNMVVVNNKIKNTSDSIENHVTPTYFDEDRGLFGWIHRPQTEKYRAPVVICNPLGFEFVRTHRTIRVLASSLAAAGFTVFRFDYDGCGDSRGSDTDDDRVAAWMESITSVVRFAQRCSGQDDINLIGIRMGATLAYQCTEKIRISNLVLWNPCVAGASFVRDMQIVERANSDTALEVSTSTDHSGVDAAGFVLTGETVSGLAGIRMAKVQPTSAPPVLLVERDDLPSGKVAERLKANGSSVEVRRTAGYKEMMLPPQRSQVPVATLDVVKDWLASHNQLPNTESHAPCDITELPESVCLATGDEAGVCERPLHFGPEQRLFGIITEKIEQSQCDSPAVILLCGGAVHRVSANRMYVPLARQLATRGFDVLRMDLSGIGDSAVADGGPINNPYAATLCDDVSAAMQVMTERTESRRFVILGLCSGAFAALEMARTSEQVVGLTLINQLVYFLSPQASTEMGADCGFDAGAEDFPRANTILDRIARKILQRTSPALMWPSRLLAKRSLGGDTSPVLRDIAARGIALDFIFSAGDPAQNALMLYAGKTVNELLRTGSATRSIIHNTDHTFSPQKSQDELISCVVENLSRRWSYKRNVSPT